MASLKRPIQIRHRSAVIYREALLKGTRRGDGDTQMGHPLFWNKVIDPRLRQSRRGDVRTYSRSACIPRQHRALRLPAVAIQRISNAIYA